jgi:mannan endo-1,6-alpha-mannosidase
MMGALIDYWYYTGDDQYNAITTQGLLHQVGPNNDYMPPNQTLTEGNDDQGFWGMAVMSAAEYKFPDPPKGSPGWLALAQAVFNTQAFRWDEADCGGGLRWQIFTWNNGFDYKNSISQGCFFNLAARLALYTGNQSYADWADKTWDWMVAANLIEKDTYYIPDGTHIGNCSDITPYQWTYNAGSFLLGAAAMYNYTTGATRETWRERTEGLLNGSMIFFQGNNSDIMTEVACEPVNLCDVDQQSFKAYLSRWMAATTKWAPWSFTRIKPLLESSAKAAAAQCKGGDNGRMCGLRWTDDGKWDGTTGVGQQMAAMEVVLANIIEQVSAPVTNATGGTSEGNAGAGGDDIGRSDPYSIIDSWRRISTGDRVGAGILTGAVVLSLLAGLMWLMLDETSDRPPHQQAARFATGVATGRFLRKKQWHGNHAGGDGAGTARDRKGKEADRASSSSSDRVRPVSTFDVMPYDPNKKLSVIETHHTSGGWMPPMKDSARAKGPIHVHHRAALSEPPAVPLPPPSTRDRRLSHPGERKRSSLRKQAAQNARYAATGPPLPE